VIKKKFRSITLFFMGFILASSLLVLTTDGQAEAQTQVKQGNIGGLVWDVQHRLQQLGLYPMNLDGHFGPVTREGVIRFQRQNGLTPDGIVGPKTLKLLRGETFTEEEIEMMAKLVYGEARGESFEGQVAVAAVVLNRLESDKFPDTVKGVIFEPQAFTAVIDGQYYATPNKTAYRAVYKAIQGWDPSGGALYYFNPEVATSDWIWSRKQITKIGKHIFAK
jgi:N-acetylmuramoyl-L-alanine amidase